MKAARALPILLTACLLGSASILPHGAASAQGRECATARQLGQPPPPGCPGARRPTPAPVPTPPTRPRPRPRPAPPPPRPVYRPPPPAPAPIIRTRALVLRNECSYAMQVRLVYETRQGWRQPGGLYWNVASGTTIGPLSYDNQTLQLVSEAVYFHITRADGTTWTFDTPYYRDYNGTQLTMGLTNASLDAAGNYYIRFTCPAPAAPPPSAPPPVPTRPIVIRNECPYSISLRLVYRGVTRIQVQPNGESWSIASGTTSNPLAHRDNSLLALSSDEVFFHITGPNGPWTFNQPVYFDYQGTRLGMGRANVSINSDGNYYIRFTCPSGS